MIADFASQAWTSLIRAARYTRADKPYIPVLPYTADWWGDRVMAMVDAVFGWKDRVPAVLLAFVSARFVRFDAGERDQNHKVKAVDRGLRKQIMKRIVESTLLAPLVDDVDTINAEPDRKFARAIYRSAQTTISDATQIVHDHHGKMIASADLAKLTGHKLVDLVKGEPLPTHVLLPALHALKDFSPEFIDMSIRRTAIILWKGPAVASQTPS
ncbi:BQ2448_3222 [Microbotryum intermedium]|uniref:BQ2448_3222 protein n=1 Tax=Microbotryum intermedium TaxID=269621 RepID=A0A238FIE1_9BASI|nr:BQ2448_3222 [Microbotryum intermedium]